MPSGKRRVHSVFGLLFTESFDVFRKTYEVPRSFPDISDIYRLLAKFAEVQ